MNTEIKNTIKNEKGFTLVELIVVIAILAVLAAVAIPNYMSYQHRSKINTDVSTVSELLRSAKMYYIERGTEPSFSDLVDNGDYTGDEKLATGSNLSTITFSADADGNFSTSNFVATATSGSFKPSGEVIENEELPRAVK